MSDIIVRKTIPSVGVRALVGALILLTVIRIIIQNSITNAPEDDIAPIIPGGDATVSPIAP